MPKQLKNHLRDFVKIKGKTAVIIANDHAGGVFRGHADVWFGDFDKEGNPIVKQLAITNDWELLPRIFGS